MLRLRWGILSTARIARQKVITAIQTSASGTVTAIASRSRERARVVAKNVGIAATTCTYSELLDLEQVDAVYIPLPNHLHVPWAIEALKAGKHVLVEKPLGLSAKDASRLAECAAAHLDLLVTEGFMYRHHPQWIRIGELVAEGMIGDVRTVHVIFSYCNTDPRNIRNSVAMGGGALMDIGCYGVSVARFLFQAEPVRVIATMQCDMHFKTDVLTTGILEFCKGHAIFTCATQAQRNERVEVVGTSGRITVPTPFNVLPDAPAFIEIVGQRGREVQRIEPANQFALQVDAFARAAASRVNTQEPLQEALRGMRCLDALAKSARTGAWVSH